MATLEALLSTLPASEQGRGRAFEGLAKWYLEHSPTYSALIRRAWSWDEWPGRWGRDAGIDLVAETHDGEFWAIQAKAYAPTTSITKKAIDSFLSESARHVFSFRLLLATTDQIGHNARQVFRGQAIPASLRMLSDLAAEPIEWPDSFEDLRAPRHEPATPRPHQLEVLDAIEQRLAHGGRGRVIMACGTGKTLVQLWAHERLASHRTLVLVPSLFLVQQSLHEWTANRTHPFEFLAVCSDDTVMPDGFVSNVTELGLPVTTDPAKIRHFLEGPGDRVIFSTYQSSGQIAEALRGTEMRFELVLADEAHRLAGQGSREFTSALRDEAIPADCRIFFTATPRYLTGKTRGKGEESDLEVVSMDDEAVFGPEIHRLSFGEAIRRELLSDYRVVVVGVSDKEALRLAKHGAVVTFEGKMTDARSLAREIGLAKAMHDFSLRRVISFHSRVTAARDFAEALRELIPRLPSAQSPHGDLVFGYVSGEMPTGDRRRLISRLRNVAAGEYALLANARCLSEGVDVPSIDGIAFIDPRRSQIDIVQAVGRAIRLSPDKSLGTIVIPVFVPDGEDAETVLWDSAFEPVWAVVRALRDYDEELAEQLDAARRRLGLERRLTKADLPARIVLDLPTGAIGPRFLDAFTARVVERTTSAWEEGFAHLEASFKSQGRIGVSAKFAAADGYKLGQWIGVQRYEYGKGLLSPERAKRLEAVSGWEWDALSAWWEEGFVHLAAYAGREGHALVPALHKAAGGYRLGQWVTVQRGAYARGELDSERTRRLNETVGWAWDALRVRWEEGFAQLQVYLAANNNPRVNADFTTDRGYRLGGWTSHQREAYAKGALSSERTARLEALPGWIWSSVGDRWEEGFAHLEAFFKREGNALMSSSYNTDGGYGLGGWTSHQREAYAKGALSPERTARLEALPGWTWDTLAEQWEEGFANLQAFVAQKGHSRVPGGFKADDGYRLGQWLSVQRKAYSRRTMKSGRAERLEAFAGWIWDTLAEQWEEGFANLQAFVAQKGHPRVPQSHKTADSYTLGEWVVTQRKAYSSRTLKPGRAERLEALPGWIWDPFAERWEKGFAHLQAFVEQKGHSRVPGGFKADDGYRLGQWLKVQRKGREDMKGERMSRLEALPGWTWDALASRWEAAFARLEGYVADNGAALVPKSYKTADSYPLGQWGRNQRALRVKGNLSADHARRLEALPGWVWVAGKEGGVLTRS